MFPPSGLSVSHAQVYKVQLLFTWLDSCVDGLVVHETIYVYVFIKGAFDFLSLD